MYLACLFRLLTALCVLLVATLAVVDGQQRNGNMYDAGGRVLWQRQVRPNAVGSRVVVPRVAVAPARSAVPVKSVAKPSDGGAIIFPTDETTTTSTGTDTTLDSDNGQVPLNVLRDISKVNSAEDFIRMYGQQGGITGRSNRTLLTAGVSLRERTISIPYAIQAVCTPQPTTVTFDLENEPYVTYFPSCTRMERCGGCCPHHLLECQATKSEPVTMQILKTRYLGPSMNKFDIAEPIVVELDRHLECQCQCRVQASHCSTLQVYRPNECRCECLNQDQAIACSDAGKFWDAANCECRCREQMQCSSGFKFNKDTCACELTRISRKTPVTRRPVIIPSFRDVEWEK